VHLDVKALLRWPHAASAPLNDTELTRNRLDELKDMGVQQLWHRLFEPRPPAQFSAEARSLQGVGTNNKTACAVWHIAVPILAWQWRWWHRERRTSHRCPRTSVEEVQGYLIGTPMSGAHVRHMLFVPPAHLSKLA